jgi:hypothetical protein
MGRLEMLVVGMCVFMCADTGSFETLAQCRKLYVYTNSNAVYKSSQRTLQYDKHRGAAFGGVTAIALKRVAAASTSPVLGYCGYMLHVMHMPDGNPGA